VAPPGARAPRAQGGRRVPGVGAPWVASPRVSKETDTVRGPELHGRPVQWRARRSARSRQPALAVVEDNLTRGSKPVWYQNETRTEFRDSFGRFACSGPA
jgi:hypothetical protein